MFLLVHFVFHKWNAILSNKYYSSLSENTEKNSLEQVVRIPEYLYLIFPLNFPHPFRNVKHLSRPFLYPKW